VVLSVGECVWVCKRVCQLFPFLLTGVDLLLSSGVHRQPSDILTERIYTVV